MKLWLRVQQHAFVLQWPLAQFSAPTAFDGLGLQCVEETMSKLVFVCVEKWRSPGGAVVVPGNRGRSEMRQSNERTHTADEAHSTSWHWVFVVSRWRWERYVILESFRCNLFMLTLIHVTFWGLLNVSQCFRELHVYKFLTFRLIFAC